MEKGCHSNTQHSGGRGAMFKSKGAKKKLDRKLYDGVKADNVREKPNLWPRVPTVSHTPTHTHARPTFQKKNECYTHTHVTTRIYTSHGARAHTQQQPSCFLQFFFCARACSECDRKFVLLTSLGPHQGGLPMVAVFNVHAIDEVPPTVWHSQRLRQSMPAPRTSRCCTHHNHHR
jgi:hypothetical protein